MWEVKSAKELDAITYEKKKKKMKSKVKIQRLAKKKAFLRDIFLLIPHKVSSFMLRSFSYMISSDLITAARGGY